MAQDDRIVFVTEDNEEIEFFVLQETQINGVKYLLVADEDDSEEANALILKEISEDENDTVIYDTVQDDDELNAIARVFEQLLDDVDIMMTKESEE